MSWYVSYTEIKIDTGEVHNRRGNQEEKNPTEANRVQLSREGSQPFQVSHIF